MVTEDGQAWARLVSVGTSDVTVAMGITESALGRSEVMKIEYPVHQNGVVIFPVTKILLLSKDRQAVLITI